MAKIHVDPKTEIEDKVKGILKLIQDGDLDMDGTPEEILKREPFAELVKKIKNIINELNVLQKEVGSLQHQKSDSAVIGDRDRLTMEIEKLKLDNEDKKQMIAYFDEKVDEFREKISALESIRRQKREYEEQLRAKERELNTLKKNYENQISANRNEISELARKNLEQEDELGKLKRDLSARKSECSALNRKLNTAEKDASAKIIASTTKVDNLQKDLLSLQKTKEELELYCEKLGEEREKLIEGHAQTLKIFDDENKKLANEIMDLQRTLKEQEDAYQKLNEEYKQVDSWFNECKVNLEVANRKIKEKEEELRESIASKDQMVDDLEHQVEDLKRDLKQKGNETRILIENVKNHEEKLCLSNQKLRDTEQLLSDKEESFRKAEEEFQNVRRVLEDRNATLVARITAANNKAFHETIKDTKVCVDSVKIGIDTVSKKFSDDCNNYEIENSIANIFHELQNVKEYVSEMNREKERLQNDKKLLLEELRGKKEDKLTLKEFLKAKVEGMGQEQMEAFRQLSLKIDNLTEIVSKSRSNC